MPSFDYLLVRFIVYGFFGWIIESGYKTIGQRRGFINSGFLKGPLIPIYGFGAVIMSSFQPSLAKATARSSLISGSSSTTRIDALDK